MPAKVKRIPTTEDELMQQALDEMDAEINVREDDELDAAVEKAVAAPVVEGPMGSPEKRPESGKRRFIIHEYRVDKFNVVRKRVELHPGICDLCGFDITTKNNLGSYYEMSEAMQDQVRRGIEEHKRVYHSAHQKLVVDEDEKPTEWLGGRPKF